MDERSRDERDLALRVANEATPDSVRDIMVTMINGTWKFASGGAAPYSMQPDQLERFRKALSTALDVIERAPLIERPEVLRQRRAAVAAGADVPLQSFLTSLKVDPREAG